MINHIRVELNTAKAINFVEQLKTNGWVVISIGISFIHLYKI